MLTLKFVGKRFLYNGAFAKCIGETDSGNIKLLVNGEEVWTDFTRLQDIDGASAHFRIFSLPLARAA